MRLLALLLLFGVAHAQGLNAAGPGQATGKPRTNLCLQSNTMSTDVAATSPWTANSISTSTPGASPVGGNWAQLQGSNNAGNFSQAVTTPSTNKFVGSVYLVGVTGTYAGIWINCGTGGNVTACTCARSDAGTCTASPSGSYCTSQVADLGTTTVIRLWVVATCTSNTTGPTLYVTPNRHTVATGTAKFAGAMLETGVTTPSKLCVTTTAAKTCKN